MSEAFDPVFQDAAQRYKLDPALLKAQALVESGLNPNTPPSGAGAIGLMQMMPDTAKALGVDPTDPTQSIYGAAALMRQNLDRYMGNVENAVRAYHGGTDQANWGPKTEAYVGKVADAFNAMKQNGGFVTAPSGAQSQPDPIIAALSGTPSQTQGVAQSAAAQAPDPIEAALSGNSAPAAQAAPSAQQAAPASPAGTVTGFDRFIKGTNDPFDAAAQLLAHLLPDGAVNGVNSAAQWMNDQPVIGPVTKALGMTPATPQQLDQRIAANEANYQAARQASGSTGTDWARMGGNVAGSAPLMALPAVGSGLPGALATGAYQGALSGALKPVTDGAASFWDQKATQAGEGAATGGALSVGGNILGRIINPSVSPELQAFIDKGGTPTVGQMLGKTGSAIEDKLSSVPFLGDLIRNSQRRSTESFNNIVYNDVLAPIGQSYEGPVGRDAVKAVGDKISAAYDELLPNLTFRADPQLAGEIGNLNSMVSFLPAQQRKSFQQFFDDKVAPALQPNGVMDGQSFKELQSALGKEASTFGGSTDAYQQKLGDAFATLKQSLDGALERSNPNVTTASGATLSDVNGAWARLVRLEQAAKNASDKADGVFTPNGFLTAVKQTDQSVRDRAFARGDALMQDTGTMGQKTIGNRYPDSGTAGRHAVQLAIGALGAQTLGHGMPGMNEAMAGTAMVGAPLAAMYTPLGQTIAKYALTQRPQGFSGPLADAVRAAMVPATIGGTYAILGPR